MIPMVSIIVPAYNVVPYIGEALESAFAQTMADFEIIVVDDGSTDDIESAIAPYRSKITFLSQPNAGPAAARNKALDAARGEYIAILDGDDCLAPTFLEDLVGALNSNPDVAVAFPDAIFFGDTPWDGKLYYDIFPKRESVDFQTILTQEAQVFGGAVYRRCVVDKVGPYDAGLRGCEDWDFWLRVAQAGFAFTFVDKPLYRYRRRQSSLSRDPRKTLCAFISVMDKVLAMPISEASRAVAASKRSWAQAQLNLITGKQMMLDNQYELALDHLRLANTVLHSRKLWAVTIGLRIAPKLVHSLFARQLRAEQHSSTGI